MKNFKLTITVVRSNPQIMREIWICSSNTMQDLTTTICILLGLRKIRGEYPKNKNLKDQTCLEEIFPLQDAVYIRLRDCMDEKKSLLIDVRFAEEQEAEEPLLFPKVSVYRGDNIAGGCFDIEKNNEIYRRFLGGIDGDSLNRMIRHFNPERMDTALRRTFAPQTLPNELQEAYTLPIHELIYSLKLGDLKDLIELTGYPIYPNQRKADLQKRFLDILGNPERIREIFEDWMSAEEFKNMKSFLMTGDVLEENVGIEMAMPALYDNGFLHKIKGEWKLSRGIYDYYKPWFNTQKEEQFTARKYYQTLFRGGLKLYGMVTKKIMRNLLGNCYPDENLEGFFESFWKEAADGRLDEDIRGIGKAHIYYTEDLSQNFAREMTDEKDFFEGKYYYPDKEELERIAYSGLGFEKDEELELFCRHRLYLSMENTKEIMKEAARYCHLGVDADLIAEKICEEAYGYGRQFLKRDCQRIIEELYGGVRSFELHGFKRNELKGGRM